MNILAVGMSSLYQLQIHQSQPHWPIMDYCNWAKPKETLLGTTANNPPTPHPKVGRAQPHQPIHTSPSLLQLLTVSTDGQDDSPQEVKPKRQLNYLITSLRLPICDVFFFCRLFVSSSTVQTRGQGYTSDTSSPCCRSALTST